jgi:hypothetical protein
MLHQEYPRQKADNVFLRHETALVIEQETPVEITIQAMPKSAPSATTASLANRPRQ